MRPQRLSLIASRSKSMSNSSESITAEMRTAGLRSRAPFLLQSFVNLHPPQNPERCPSAGGCKKSHVCQWRCHNAPTTLRLTLPFLSFSTLSGAVLVRLVNLP